jgi:ketosteroid isomerase-like protein
MGCSDARDGSISSAELERVKAADQAYATAWLANDSEQVMATLTMDAVIVPSGMPVMEGTEAIRRFWWPEGSPPTNVTEFALVQREVGGHGDVGFVRGSFSLGFEYDGNTYSSGGEYLSLLRRAKDGSWRISHRMWSDRPRDTDDS